MGGMSLFVVFILAAVLLGAGTMLAPAWRSAQPRVSLAATLCLALLTGGSVFYSEAFGWDTLVVDYLLFGLLSGVILGGTLSTAQARAEARGEVLADRDQGWPGPQDLLYFALVAALICLPLWHLPASLGTQGQALALHSLATRMSHSFLSLAPFAPESTALVAPGLHALSAYLSQQLALPVPLVQQSLGAVLLLLLLWLAYDFAAELQGKPLGRTFSLALLLSAAALRSMLGGHYSALMALLFLLAFLLYALRLLQQFRWADLIAGGLMMGAVFYSNLSLTVVMALLFLALLAFAWAHWGAACSRKSRLGLALGMPLVALLGTAPWLLRHGAELLALPPSPYPADVSYWQQMFSPQGLLMLPLALWGAALGLRAGGRIAWLTGLMLAWLLLVIDLALLGWLSRLFPLIDALSHAPNIARHGAVLPLAWLSGLALLQLWRRLPRRWQLQLRSRAYALMAALAALLLLGGLAFPALQPALAYWLSLPPASINRDEAAAMDWLRQHSPPDALLYAVDENGWLPVFSERRATHLRALQFFEWGELPLPAAKAQRAADFVYVPAAAEAPAWDLRPVYEHAGIRIYAPPAASG